MAWAFREANTGAIVLHVRVTPRAKHSGLSIEGQRLRVRLSAPPTDGKANRELVKLLAQRFAVAKTAITVRSGARSRDKTVAVSGPVQWPAELSPPPDGLSCDPSTR